MKNLLVILTVMIMTTTNLVTQQVSLEEAKPYLTAFEKVVEIPKAYKFHSVNKVKIDKVFAYLFRYEKDENKGMNGEHFSFLVGEKDKTILGFINMDKKYANTQLLSEVEAEKKAKAFLEKVDTKLAGELENQYIRRHDDIIKVGGKETTLAVMKHKCYRSSENDYAWVYVGFDGSIQAFERNTKWDMSKRQRFAEQWLHDSWRSKNKK